MTDKALKQYFALHRRYYRSVNLVRDLDKASAVEGYIPTERATDGLRRILATLTTPNSHRAWTITGVYGTGKSAFAHYLLALCAASNAPVHQEAAKIAQRAFEPDSPEWTAITQIPEQGLLRIVATGQREPLCWTLARAMTDAADRVWSTGKKPKFWKRLADWQVELDERQPAITNQEVLDVLAKMIQAAEMPIILVVDELGKSLEYAAQHDGIQDLYLLQQLAEWEAPGPHQLYFLGLLHQSFAGYSDRLGTKEQSEWNKIHGRFEDIPFSDAPGQMTRLIGQAIDRSQADPIIYAVHQAANAWYEALKSVLNENEVSQTTLETTYPLHPVAALVLPLLCTRYAQNDRSLFSFLTSDEPYGLQAFLQTAQVAGETIPVFKLHQLYDYFVESVGGLASRNNFQRWVEVRSLVEDARGEDADVLQALKTIGILNLITTSGALKATPQLSALALCDRPERAEIASWQQVIKSLEKRGLITYRRQGDELRIWQGSDFNVEAAIYDCLEQLRSPLADVLTLAYPLSPLVAQRHYATTGTLRYFEQRYGDARLDWEKVQAHNHDCDGLVVYWLEEAPLTDVPPLTADGKPLLVVEVGKLELLRTRAEELQALKQIWKSAPELQNDGVARREVKQRLAEAERLLDATVRQTFDWSNEQNQCWREGKHHSIANRRQFQAALSDLCDRVYAKTPHLDNELINRRVLTSQGAKARKTLIEAMLERADQVAA
jgi:hypothetical protein